MKPSRWFAVVAVILALTVVPAAARTSLVGATPTRSCAPFEFIGVAGSGELEDGTTARKSLWMGNTIKGLYNTVLKRYKGSRTTFDQFGVRYAAIPVDLDPTHVDVYLQNYARSVQQGVDNLHAHLNSVASACPDQQFVLAGYSQGADVIRRAMGEFNVEIVGRTRAVLLFGDPRYNPNNVEENVGNPTVGTRQGLISLLTGTPGPVDPPDLQARTRDYCDAGDIICQGPPGSKDPHLHYGDWATFQAAGFLTRLEPPAQCDVSTASWSSTSGPGSPSKGVTITNVNFAQAQPNAGYRFVGFVAVADEYVYDPNIDGYAIRTVRVEQPSYQLIDPNVPFQSVVNAGRVFYFLARAVPEKCGVSSELSFSIPVAEDRHVLLQGRLTSSGTPVGGALLVWYHNPLDGDTLYPDGTDFSNLTKPDGTWRAEYFGPVKVVIEPGHYRMTLVFPGDVNHLPASSPEQDVTVAATG